MGSASASPRERFEAPLDQIWLIAFWGRSNTMLLFGDEKGRITWTRGYQTSKDSCLIHTQFFFGKVEIECIVTHKSDCVDTVHNTT